MNTEEFSKYFLYSLLDHTITEVRFYTRPDSEEFVKETKTVIWSITNFLIELPFELYKASSKKESGFYLKLVQEYEEYSERIGLNRWFNDTKKTRYSFYCRKQGLTPDSSELG